MKMTRMTLKIFRGCSKASGKNLSGRFAHLPCPCGVPGRCHFRILTPLTNSLIWESWC